MASADSIKALFSKVINYFKNMEKGKRVRLIVLVLLIISIAIALTAFLNQKTYTVLYSGMDPKDTGEVLTMLDQMGVDAKTQGQDTIIVADEQVDKIRLELASQGYPSSGVNYDIYSNASGLGTTDSEKEKYYQFQLQANLENTIKQMDKVKDATVYIDLGQDSAFVLSGNNKPATASVMLTLGNGETLSGSEVKAIAELVSKSVSGLDPANIRIVDSQMNLYSTGNDNDIQTADSHLELQSSVKEQLQQQIINLLGPVFGEGNVLAQVSVTLNFDSTKKESVQYTLPAGSTDGIVVSMKELVEAITNDQSGNGSAAGLDANGNASQYLAALDKGNNAVYYNISREVNYDVDQTTTQIEEAQGQIEDLSVSVILNSSNIDNYADEVKNLVATAIGARSEKITVEMLPFAAETAEQASNTGEADAMKYEQQIADAAESAQTRRVFIVVAAAVIIMIILLLIVRTLRTKQAETAGGNTIDIIVDDSAGSVRAAPETKDIDEIADKDNNLSALEDYIGKNPESAANLLRNWLNEE